MTHVETAPHECEGNLIYCDVGLGPYWRLGQLLIQAFDGYVDEVETVVDGERWELSLSYQKGGIAPRADDRVGGDRLYEYRIAAHGDGERKANFLVQPRFEAMRHYESGDRIPTPFDSIDESEGINVHFAGSNLEPEEYRTLLPESVQALGDAGEMAVNGGYFRGRVHEMSNITTYERYVRLHRSKSQTVVGRTGVMSRLLTLCAHEKGSKFEYKVDNEEIVGKNHRVVLGKEDAGRLIPTHRYGKQIKHYHPKHVREKESDDPLYHPKLGVLLKKSLNGHAIPWNDRRDARREIEETLINALHWSGVPVQADPTTYIADDHFVVREADEPVELRQDPTPEMDAQQDALIITVLRDLCESDVDVLERLVADGGTRTVNELEDETGRATSTLYRALKRMNGIVQNDRGRVSFTSKKVEQEIAAVVESAEYQIENATDRVANLLDVELRSSASSAWEKWCRKYGAQITSEPTDQQLTVRIDTVLSRLKTSSHPHAKTVLREALEAWMSTGRTGADLEGAWVEFRTEGGDYDGWFARTLLR